MIAFNGKIYFQKKKKKTLVAIVKRKTIDWELFIANIMDIELIFH